MRARDGPAPAGPGAHFSPLRPMVAALRAHFDTRLSVEARLRPGMHLRFDIPVERARTGALRGLALEHSYRQLLSCSAPASSSDEQALISGSLVRPCKHSRGGTPSCMPMVTQSACEAPPWLTIAESAHMLRVSEWTVRRWIREGRLSSARPGHRRLVARLDVERLLGEPRPKE